MEVADPEVKALRRVLLCVYIGKSSFSDLM